MTVKRRLSFRLVGKRSASFTIVELLVSMAIIGILAGLLIYASQAIIQESKRSRTSSEIQAMSTGLEAYKVDNGIYPQSDGLLLAAGPSAYTNYDGSGTIYKGESQILYKALSGKTNYNDVPVTNVRCYMNFKPNELGNVNAAAGTTGAGSTYIQDPWQLSYGYSTGSTNGSLTNYPPNNGSGFFDLWSTGHTYAPTPNTSAWIANWQ